MENDEAVLAYFGHHKCATKFLSQIINNICQYMRLNYANYHSPKMWGYKDGYTLDKVVEHEGLDFVSYTNTDAKYLGNISIFRGFHVIRDPRDVVVSSYFSHKNSHPLSGWPELAEICKVLNTLSKDEGMIEDMKFTATLPTNGWNINYFENLMEWNYSLPNILEIKFERLVEDPYSVLLEMFDFLGMLKFQEVDPEGLIKYILRNKYFRRYPKIKYIPAWLVLFQAYGNRFSRVSRGRRKGIENENSHYRKGLPGDWKNHFTNEHKMWFKKNYNDLLIKLGYESNDEW